MLFIELRLQLQCCTISSRTVCRVWPVFRTHNVLPNCECGCSLNKSSLCCY